MRMASVNRHAGPPMVAPEPADPFFEQQLHIRMISLTAAVLGAAASIYVWRVWRPGTAGILTQFAVVVAALTVLLGSFAQALYNKGRWGGKELPYAAGWILFWTAVAVRFPENLIRGFAAVAATAGLVYLLARSGAHWLLHPKGHRWLWGLIPAAVLLLAPLATLVWSDARPEGEDVWRELLFWCGPLPLAAFCLVLAWHIRSPRHATGQTEARAPRPWFIGAFFVMFEVAWLVLWVTLLAGRSQHAIGSHWPTLVAQVVALGVSGRSLWRLGQRRMRILVGLSLVPPSALVLEYYGPAAWRLLVGFPGQYPNVAFLLGLLGAAVTSLIFYLSRSSPAGGGIPAARIPASDEPDVAYVVIHGMAQQKRYQTLDALANGFRSMDPGQNQQVRKARLETLPPEYANDAFGYCLMVNGRPVHTFEIYWAPIAQGAQTWRAVAVWAVTSLIGWFSSVLRFGRQNRDNQARRDVMKKQAVLATWVAAFLAIGVVAGWGVWATYRYAMAQYSTEPLTQPVASLLLLGCLVLAGVNSLRYLVGTLSTLLNVGETQLSPPDDPVLLTPADRGRRETLLRFTLQVGSTVFWTVTYTISYQVLVHVLHRGKLVPFVYSAGLLTFALWGLRKFLAEILGDVPTYFTYDEFTAQFKVRQKIQDKATQILLAALREHKQVVFVAHSLGSGVARDVVRQLWLHHPNQFSRLHALVTIGCPWRKFRNILERSEPGTNGDSPLNSHYNEFIFRAPPGWERPASSQAIPAALPSSAPPPGWQTITKDAAGMAQPPSLSFAALPWYNFWILTDVFADPLRDCFPVLYELQIPWGFRNLYWSHSDYWKSRLFFQALVEMLEPGTGQGKPPVAKAVADQVALPGGKSGERHIPLQQIQE